MSNAIVFRGWRRRQCHVVTFQILRSLLKTHYTVGVAGHDTMNYILVIRCFPLQYIFSGYEELFGEDDIHGQSHQPIEPNGSHSWRIIQTQINFTDNYIYILGALFDPKNPSIDEYIFCWSEQIHLCGDCDINILRPKQDVRHFADDAFTYISLNGNMNFG